MSKIAVIDNSNLFKRVDVPSPSLDDFRKQKSPDCFFVIMPKVGTKIVVDQMVFVVKRVMGRGRFMIQLLNHEKYTEIKNADKINIQKLLHLGGRK